MPDPTLKDALDGLIDATEYANEAGLEELSQEAADLYQAFATTAPDHDWDTDPTAATNQNGLADVTLQTDASTDIELVLAYRDSKGLHELAATDVGRIMLIKE